MPETLPIPGFRILERRRFEQGWLFVIAVAEDNPHFAGHFPGEPILPAVAQFELVSALQSLIAPSRARLARIEVARFKEPVRPGDRLVAKLTPVDGNLTSRFVLHRDNLPVSEGIVGWAPPP